LRTAFGGSINAVATLAAYGFVWLGLRDRTVHVVVAESSIRFLRPVRETIRAICPRPDSIAWAAFQTQLAAKKKAHIILRVNVVEEGQVTAAFEGTFVVRENLRQERG
jgi:thioesterase domain-containing protein